MLYILNVKFLPVFYRPLFSCENFYCILNNVELLDFTFNLSSVNSSSVPCRCLGFTLTYMHKPYNLSIALGVPWYAKGLCRTSKSCIQGDFIVFNKVISEVFSVYNSVIWISHTHEKCNMQIKSRNWTTWHWTKQLTTHRNQRARGNFVNILQNIVVCNRHKNDIIYMHSYCGYSQELVTFERET